MSVRNDIMRFSVLGFRSDIRIELQAPVISYKLIMFLFVYLLLVSLFL